MDYVVLVIILIGSLGVVLMIYALANFKNYETEAPEESGGSRRGGSLDEVDSAMNELTDMSKTVFEEFNGKYQELLFLYKLVSDKKDELQRLSGGDGKVAADSPLFNEGDPEDVMEGFDYSVDEYTSSGRHVDFTVDDRSALLTMLKGEKVKNILELRKNGMEVSEIAKSMGIGKGEVQMALDLNRMATKGRAKK